MCVQVHRRCRRGDKVRLRVQFPVANPTSRASPAAYGGSKRKKKRGRGAGWVWLNGVRVTQISRVEEHSLPLPIQRAPLGLHEDSTRTHPGFGSNIWEHRRRGEEDEAQLRDAAFPSSSCVSACYNYSSLSGFVAPNTSEISGPSLPPPLHPPNSVEPRARASSLEQTQHPCVCSSLTALVIREGCDSRAGPEQTAPPDPGARGA